MPICVDVPPVTEPLSRACPAASARDRVQLLCNRLFEDRRVGRDATEPVPGNQALELATGEQATVEIVQPDGLTEVLQCPNPVRSAGFTPRQG